MIEDIIRGEYAKIGKNIKHFEFGEWGTFGNGAGQYGFNQNEMGDPNMMRPNQNDQYDPSNPMVPQQSYGGMDPGPNPCSGSGFNHEPPQQIHIAPSPSPEPIRPIGYMERMTKQDPFLKDQYIDLPESGVQIHPHGIGNAVTQCHFKDNAGSYVKNDEVFPLISGYDYCRAEVNHMAINPINALNNLAANRNIRKFAGLDIDINL